MRVAAFFLTVPLIAHTVSLSTGELTVAGRTATYRLRMPLWEVQHVHTPEQTLPAAITIEGADQTGRRCAAEDDSYACVAEWLFPHPPEQVSVRVRLHDVTVPNHVHMLHAVRGELIDQAVFDARQTEAILRFRASGPLESALRRRPASALAFLLSIAAIAMLGSGWRRFAGVAAGFVAGIAAGAMLPWTLTPLFLEAVIAVLAAYAAFETAFLPQSGQKWITATVLGAACGLYGTLLVPPALTRIGITSAGLAVALLMSIILLRIPPIQRFARIAAAATACVWLGSILL